MMTANEIRDSYLKFFESKGHVIVPSAFLLGQGLTNTLLLLSMLMQ